MALKKQDWVSERVLFGAFIIVGYFGLTTISATLPGVTDSGRGVIRDVLMTIGPMIGIIVQSIWKVDKVDKINAETNAVRAAKAPDMSPVAPILAAAAVGALPTQLGGAPLGSQENPVAVDIQPSAEPESEPSPDSPPNPFAAKLGLGQ